MLELNTFSIAARCERTGMLGVAVSTAVPAVGAICPFIASDCGAISTQSWVNPYLGIDGIDLLKQGMSAQAVLDKLIADDPGRDVRQVGVVDKTGQSAAYTGKSCVPWAGHLNGMNYAVQGNMLVGSATIEAMVAAFERTKMLDLPERLIVVLEAAQIAGGDKRGRQSAAMKVYWKEDFPYLDLRVDEHRHPVPELRRVFEVARHQLLPFVSGMPSRENPLGSLPDHVTAMLLTSPPYRPGGGGGVL